MKYFKKFEDIKLKKKLIVLLGNFDGFHLGHQELLKKAFSIKKRNKKNDYFILIITFEPYYKQIKNKKIKRLTTLSEKIKLAEFYKVDGFLAINFTNKFSHMTKKEFLNEILFHNLNISTIITGRDFCFGYKGEGNNSYLKKECKSFSCNLEVIPPYKINNRIVSSTIIRKLLEYGDILKAQKLLGRSYLFSGKIIYGNGIGKNLGFPTANIKIEKTKLIPKLGVYIIEGVLKNKNVKGICNIGKNPTFNKNNFFSVEIYILNFSKNVYCENFIFKILHRLREEIKFNSKKELIEQLKKDKKNALKYFKTC